jgi:hypothetical protein
MMKSFSRFLLWTLVFALLLLGIDQLLLHVRFELPVYRETRHFYLDLRGRLLGTGPSEPRSVEEAIEPFARHPDREPAPPLKPAAPAPEPPSGSSPPSPEDEPRYLYVDREGNLHFADSLAEVPAPYRDEARKMTR